MEYSAFIELIQERGGIEEFGVAERAASAVLEVLGEHLTRDQAISIDEQLPTHIRDAILQNNAAESFGLDEFIIRVSEREEIGRQEAENHVRAVLSVLPEATSLESARNALSQLPDEIRTLIEPVQRKSAPGEEYQQQSLYP